jgi:hypothetical protein
MRRSHSVCRSLRGRWRRLDRHDAGLALERTAEFDRHDDYSLGVLLALSARPGHRPFRHLSQAIPATLTSRAELHSSRMPFSP